MHPLYEIKQVLKGIRGVAQLVSASALGAEGPPFESEYPDKKELYESMTLFFVYDPSGLPGLSCCSPASKVPKKRQVWLAIYPVLT